MPAVQYPEPADLSAYREANPVLTVWQSIGLTSTPPTEGPTLPDAIVITTAGFTPVIGTYTKRGLYQGEAYYNLLGSLDTPDASSIAFDGSTWAIYGDDTDPVYTSTYAGSYPWEVTDWTPVNNGALPVPTLVPPLELPEPGEPGSLYDYPEPDSLVAYRQSYPNLNIWESLNELTTWEMLNGGSYTSFPYLPTSILQNNALAPFQDFIDIPYGGPEQPLWTEFPPSGWSQSSAYYNIFLKWYLKIDGSDEPLPTGGGRIHILKIAGLGSSLGLLKDNSLTGNTVSPLTNFETRKWSVYSIRRTVEIPAEKTSVNFGAFFRHPSLDPLRSLNFAGIALYFSKNNIPSYLNFARLATGGDLATIQTIPASLTDYLYISTYDPAKTYEAYNQWLGRPIMRVKRLPDPAFLFNEWQFVNYQADVPNFRTLAPSDGVEGKADACTLMIFFAENHSYINNAAGNTGSLQLARPFISLN